jgi:TetR/AcrR family transcriptional regulator, mexJK operon transcriptional repressor
LDLQPDTAGASGETGAETARSVRRRQAILAAATEVFVRHGYLGATTDQVAAAAAVSKQTVYKQFGDKQHLFAEVIGVTTTGVADRLGRVVAATLGDVRDVRTALRDLARGFLHGLLQPDVLRLRRLVIAEADRFPEVGRAWFEHGFDRALVILGQALRDLEERGLLHDLGDPRLAAYQFAGLVMYLPMNQLMFAGTGELPPDDELDRIAGSAVEVFLARYR